jgi:hypothetical protein
LLPFDIAAVRSKLCGDRSLRDQLQICEPPFVDSIARRSRELLASRPGVLQTLTSCRYQNATSVFPLGGALITSPFAQNFYSRTIGATGTYTVFNGFQTANRRRQAESQVDAAANAQAIIDMGAFTCDQYLAMSPAMSRDFSAWMSGWFSNQSGRRVVDVLVHQKNIAIVKSWCQSHPQASVMSALQSAIGPQ